MKKLGVRMRRALLFALGLMPAITFVNVFLINNMIFGALWFFFQTLLMALLTLLPAYLGNYREYEVVKYEGAKGNDPNPDREAIHTLVREGHRFPLRLTADLILIGVMVISVFPVSRERFIDASLARRVLFAVLNALVLLIAAHDLPTAAFVWEDIPGIVIGIAGYFAMALYLHFFGGDVVGLKALISVCAVLYLFFGAVALNRQSIVLSMSAHSGEEKRVPRLITRKNRRIVIGFSALVTVVSLIEPIKKGVLWFFRKIGDLLLWIRMLFGYKPSSSSALPMSTMTEGIPQVGPETVETAQAAGGSNLIVYLFLGFVALAFLFLVFEGLKKLSDRLAKWMEKFQHNVNEGFYDEKEELMTADEMRDRLKNSLKRGLESLFKREKSWKELNGRERARRLMKAYYKKRAGKVNNLRVKTAREVLGETRISESSRALFSEAYDKARYSGHEVNCESMDELKKDLRL